MHAVFKCCNEMQLLSKRTGLEKRFIGREDGGNIPDLDFWNLTSRSRKHIQMHNNIDLT